MNIYDVFRRMIEGRAFQDHERVEALKLLDELEELNVLGTLAGGTEVGHQHHWVDMATPYSAGFGRAGMTGARKRCTICSLEE